MQLLYVGHNAIYKLFMDSFLIGHNTIFTLFVERFAEKIYFFFLCLFTNKKMFNSPS